MNNKTVIKSIAMRGLEGAITYSLPDKELELEEYTKELGGHFREALTKSTDEVVFYVGSLPLLSKSSQIALLESIMEQNAIHKDLFIAFEDETSLISSELNTRIDAYIKKHFKEKTNDYFLKPRKIFSVENAELEENVAETKAVYCCSIPKEFKREPTFSETVLDYIKKKDITEVECYKRAFIDRRIFSKLRSNVAYQPSKMTAIALIIALRLDAREAKELLKKAGYALSPCIIGDLIIKYYIEQGEYDINEINSVLFSYKQKLIGYNS